MTRETPEQIAERMVLSIPTEIDKASITIGPPQDSDEAIVLGWSLYVFTPTQQMADKAEREIRGWISDAIKMHTTRLTALLDERERELAGLAHCVDRLLSERLNDEQRAAWESANPALAKHFAALTPPSGAST